MKRAVLAVVIVVCLVGPAAAQFVVFDPSNFQEAIQQLVQLEQQYAQLVRSYELMTEQAMRAPGDLGARYRSLAAPWLPLTAPDTYGTTGGWTHAANTGHDVLAGYQQATQPLQTYGAGLDAMPADELARVKDQYGAVELSDGVTVHALEMLGHLRGHASDVEFALRRLEDDSYSGDPALNTQVAVLNKINAATVTAARLTKDTNQVLIALLDERLLEERRRRDAETIAINAQIAFQAQARDLLSRSTQGTTETLLSFRLP